MANVLVQESSLRSIADAIREKNGSSATYKPSQMAPAIEALDMHPGLVLPYAFDLDTGYVMYGEWKIGGGTVNYSDVYAVSANRTYLLALGNTVGTRFRSLFTEGDTTTATADMPGITLTNISGPQPYAEKTYTPETDGFITVTKDNAGQAGLKTYLFCVQDLVDSI